MPAGLPARFEPRSSRRAPQVAWRPLAVGLAVALVVGAALAREGAPGGVKTAVHMVTTAASRLAPAPAPAVTPVQPPPPQQVQPQPAPPARRPAVQTAGPMPVPAGTPTGDSSPTAAPSPAATPSGAMDPLLSPTAQATGPSPSPSGFCLPMLPLCL